MPIPDIDIPEIVSLIDPRSPCLPELLNSNVNAPVMLLDHEGADQEAGSVEAVGAVDTHNVQWVLADVLPVYQETVLKCPKDPVPEVPPNPR